MNTNENVQMDFVLFYFDSNFTLQKNPNRMHYKSWSGTQHEYIIRTKYHPHVSQS